MATEMTGSSPSAVAAVVFPHEHCYESAAKRRLYTEAAALARKKRKCALNRKTSYRIGKNSTAGRQQISIQTTKENEPTATLVNPDVSGIQLLIDELREGGTASIPTETTYEKVELWNEKDAFSYSKRPHVYLPSVDDLESSPFWKTLLERKTYGIRHEENKVLATFNECVAVIHRLAPVVWPGPVFIYVQVKRPVPGVSVTVSNDGNCFSTDSVVRHYVKLRSPRHPLAIRICKEFAMKTPGSPPQIARLPPAMVSPLRLTAIALPQCFRKANTSPSPSPTTSPRRIASCSSFSSVHSTSSTSLSAMSVTETLVGWPIMQNKKYVTAARCVPEGTVLNGEERREVLSVPTCQVPMQDVATIYIDADKRTVALQGNLPDISLRSKAATSNKERVVQALLLKWNIVRLETARQWE